MWTLMDVMDLMDAETIMGLDITVFEGICYFAEDLYIEPINEFLLQSLRTIWVGFDHVVVCDDNEDVIILLKMALQLIRSDK